jgi:hypothetical protein
MDIVSTGLSYMDIVNYKQYRFKNTGTGFVKETELPGKVYGSLEVLISIMTENRIMRLMELSMLTETGSRTHWIIIKIQGQVLI